MHIDVTGAGVGTPDAPVAVGLRMASQSNKGSIFVSSMAWCVNPLFPTDLNAVFNAFMKKPHKSEFE
jgi:hypothetical protein